MMIRGHHLKLLDCMRSDFFEQPLIQHHGNAARHERPSVPIRGRCQSSQTLVLLFRSNLLIPPANTTSDSCNFSSEFFELTLFLKSQEKESRERREGIEMSFDFGGVITL